jgi:hypothetical protein
VSQNFLGDRWIFDTCANLERATTAIADRDINIKHSLGHALNIIICGTKYYYFKGVLA